MNTRDFKTRTIFEARPAPYKRDRWVVGLDIGYSGIKGYAANKVFCFPAYARKVPNNQVVLKDAEKTDIRYRDENGTWIIGELAYEDVNSSDVTDSETELFGRHRYYSPMFSVISRAGMALGLTTNQFGSAKDKKFVVQAGLPPKYLISDSDDVKEALSGRHKFELKVGTSDWVAYDFELDYGNIHIMPQPLGALVSVSVGKNGRQLPEAKKYFSSNVEVIDPGFGTCDDYFIQNGTIKGTGETFPELGMREIFERTCKDIYDAYGLEIRVPELQKKLESGEIKVINKKEFSSKKYPFDSFLEKNCQNVCRETIEKMKSIHNYFQNTDIIIATGGTYDAWKDSFQEVFKDMEDLLIIPANINDSSLSNIFSNVRGYYFYRLNQA